jgi:hypothetical protein
MTHDELVAGYENLQRRLTEDRAIFERIRNKLSHLKNPLTSPHLSWRQKVSYGIGLLIHGILPGGPRRIAYFLRSCLPALRRPKTLAVILTDWIAALSLKSYRTRHFDKTSAGIETAFQKLQAAVGRALRNWEGVSLRIAAWDGIDRLRIEIKDAFDFAKIFALSRAIRRTLRKTQEGIVIDCRALKEGSAVQVSLLLKKLRRYHRRVYVQVPEALYRLLREDLAPYQYTLVPA